MSRWDISTTSRYGYFTAKVRSEWEVTPNGADRHMILARRVIFVDSEGRRWIAPKNLRFDGASIPRALWTLVGSPFDGDYRRAAVIHDAIYRSQCYHLTPGDVPIACTRADADSAFYNAMRADGVGAIKANIIYRAVRLFGARPWENKRER